MLLLIVELFVDKRYRIMNAVKFSISFQSIHLLVIDTAVVVIAFVTR